LNIGVDGHTDNVPIKHSGWQSNWELSSARATNVVRFLVLERSLPPQSFAAIGYGEYRPIVPNDTDAARSKNRRIVFLIKSSSK